VTFTSLGYYVNSVAIADLNGDGKRDVVTTSFCGGIAGCGSGLLNVGVLINNSAAPSLTTLTSSFNPSVVSQSVTFTATVTGQLGTPTGSVTFTINGSNPVVVPLNNGQATFSLTFTSSGSQTVVATYSGDANYLSGVSASLHQTVNPPVVTLSGFPQQPLTKDAHGDFVAMVTIANTGNITIPSIQVTVAGTTLGTGTLLSAPPPVTNLAVGASAQVTLTFPPTSVPAGTTAAPLKLSGTYSVPAIPLSGNWGLGFRSVSLQ
jgi:hypothetical protein